MRHLLLAILCFVCLGAYAQSEKQYNAVGFYFDLGQKITDVYEDVNYKPDEFIKYSIKEGEEYTPGYYYDLSNNKVKGYLQYVSTNPKLFWFKESISAIERKIKAIDCNGYVIGNDSFAVIQNYHIERKLGSLPKKEKEFAEVIDKFDNMAFYKHTYMDMNQALITYIVKKDTGAFISFPKTKKGFKEVASEWFGAYPSLVQRIQSGELKNEDFPTIIKLYKYKRYFDTNRRIFYNQSGDETDDTTHASYYSIIHSVKDSVFHISYHNKKGVKLYEGQYTSFFPHRKLGDFTWYYPNGTKRKVLNYAFGKPTLTTTYFNNGQIHYVYKQSEEEGTVFRKVFSPEGKMLISNLGHGIETFYDSIAGKQITCEYESFKAKNVYYTDAQNRRVYRLCEKNSSLKSRLGLERLLNDVWTYPESSILNGSHGLALVKCIVEPDGLVSDIQLLKGVDGSINSNLNRVFSDFKSEPKWKPGKIGGEEVVQEVVISVDCFVQGYSWYRNNYFNNSFFMNQMMRQNMMRPPTPNLPAPRF
jgi:hypothetical protein